MERNINILLAEDDENLGQLLTAYLTSKGFTVSLAKTGKIAYEKFNGNKIQYHLLLLDVMMPEMDGFTLGREIRELDKQIPIIYLTAKALKEDKLEGFDIGADDYITKPFIMEELLARINIHLNLRQLQQDLSDKNRLLHDKNKLYCLLQYMYKTMIFQTFFLKIQLYRGLTRRIQPRNTHNQLS
jgi:DNA-binding response OmpR family regulator